MDKIRHFWKKGNTSRLGLMVVLFVVVGTAAWYAHSQYTGMWEMRLRTEEAESFREAALERYWDLEHIDLYYRAGGSEEGLAPFLRVDCRYDRLSEESVAAMAADVEALITDVDFLSAYAEAYMRRYGGKAWLEPREMRAMVYFYLGDETVAEQNIGMKGGIPPLAENG